MTEERAGWPEIATEMEVIVVVVSAARRPPAARDGSGGMTEKQRRIAGEAPNAIHPARRGRLWGSWGCMYSPSTSERVSSDDAAAAGRCV